MNGRLRGRAAAAAHGGAGHGVLLPRFIYAVERALQSAGVARVRPACGLEPPVFEKIDDRALGAAADREVRRVLKTVLDSVERRGVSGGVRALRHARAAAAAHARHLGQRVAPRRSRAERHFIICNLERGVPVAPARKLLTLRVFAAGHAQG